MSVDKETIESSVAKDNNEDRVEINPKEIKLSISALHNILLHYKKPVPTKTSPIKEGRQTDDLKNTILTSLSWTMFFQHAVTVARDCYNIYATEVDVVVKAFQKLKTDADTFFNEAREILGGSFDLKSRDFTNKKINEDTRRRSPARGIRSPVQTFAETLSGMPFDNIKNDLLRLRASLAQPEKEDLIIFITENVRDSIEYFLDVTEERFKKMTPVTIKNKMGTEDAVATSSPSFTPMATATNNKSSVLEGDAQRTETSAKPSK